MNKIINNSLIRVCITLQNTCIYFYEEKPLVKYSKYAMHFAFREVDFRFWVIYKIADL